MSDSIDPRLLTSKWRLHMRPNTPSTLTTGETVEDILRDIIAMPSITGNYEANREGLNYIERFLSQRGMHTIRHEWNGIESLVATTRPTKTPTVFLMGHFDVVAAPADMFQLRQDDQKYYGRGVLDMKGAIAAFLATVNQLNNLQDYDFGIMITTDEEVGGFDGAQLLAQEGYVPKVMILPDGGANWNIERFCKGIWFTTFTATGKSAHGSRPWEGDNAITKLMDALREIQALFSAKPSETTSTMNVGSIQGGHSINSIPASATASVDFRFGSQTEMDTMRKKIMAIADKHGINVQVEVNADPVETDPNNKYLLPYVAYTEEIIGHPIKWIVSNAGNDGRFFIEKGAVCAVSYPEGGNHHGAGEWIGKDSLVRMQQIYTKYITDVAH